MPTAPQPFATGEVLTGGWRLERVLGKGGMGTVYEATELQLGRKVAVKVLHRQDDGEDFARFEREARMMAKLDHPNLVPLYAFGRHGEVPFIVMRLLEGARLSAVLKENGGRLAWAQWRPLLAQLCDALGYMHAKQVVHRDVKPSNIFVGPTGWVTLLDMGLTRGWRTPMTRTGMVWGTPEFMSPEQAMAERELDGRSDLYSVACLTWLVLSGRLPFSERDTQRLLEQHLNDERPHLHQSAGVPRALSDVVRKAMAIEADERPESMQALLGALDFAAQEKTEPGARAPPAAEQERAERSTADRTTVTRRRRGAARRG